MPSPGHLALVTGLVSSSYFAFANIGGAFFGVMPATARGNTALPTEDRLALWHFAYEIGKVHMAGSGFTSAVALSYVAYVTPNPLRKILIAGAAAAYASAVFTFVFLMPINNDLIATLQSTSSKTMEPKQEQRVLGQLDKWRALHRARIVLGIISWAASLTTVLASGPFIQFGGNHNLTG